MKIALVIWQMHELVCFVLSMKFCVEVFAECESVKIRRFMGAKHVQSIRIAGTLMLCAMVIKLYLESVGLSGGQQRSIYLGCRIRTREKFKLTMSQVMVLEGHAIIISERHAFTVWRRLLLLVMS